MGEGKRAPGGPEGPQGAGELPGSKGLEGASGEVPVGKRGLDQVPGGTARRGECAGTAGPRTASPFPAGGRAGRETRPPGARAGFGLERDRERKAGEGLPCGNCREPPERRARAKAPQQLPVEAAQPNESFCRSFFQKAGEGTHREEPPPEPRGNHP